MTKRVAILISGGGSNMVSLLESMTGAHPARSCLVLANRGDAGGLAKARARGVPTDVIERKTFGKDRAAFEKALHARLVAAEPDIICLAGFMRILSPDFISGWAGQILNIHPSLLPLYKGLHTHQRALDAGDRWHGCSVHEVTGELDGGPVLGQARLEINADDTAATLAARVLPLEHRLYPAVLERFAHGDRGRIDHAAGSADDRCSQPYAAAGQSVPAVQPAGATGR